MRALLSRWVDPFVVTLLVVLVLGLVVPVGPGAQRVVDAVADVAVTLLFLVYGMRLSTREVWAGLRNWRLQGGILAATLPRATDVNATDDCTVDGSRDR